MTLVGRPRLIFLDEPTTGLDPRSRRTMWQAIRELVAEGTTILLTTQYLEEADQLADRIAVLDGGRLVAEGTAAELKRRIRVGTSGCSSPTPRARAAAAGRSPARPATTRRSTLLVPSDGSVAALRAVLGPARRGVGRRRGAVLHTPDLDDVFLALTGPDGAAARSEPDEHHDPRRDATRRRCTAAACAGSCATRR